MKDPTRIAPLLDLLRDAWEAQPDLALSELWGILENRGIGWGAEDEQVAAELRALLREHPVAVGEEPVLVRTTAPEKLVSIHPGERAVIVRDPDPRRQPTWWTYGELLSGRVGAPLILGDEEGIPHRLGVIRSIDALAGRPRDLGGLSRRSLGDAAYACRLHGGGLAVIGHAIHLYEKQRRSVSHTRLRWERIESGAVGEPLVLRLRDGTEKRELGAVDALLPLS
ncbi:hypothetical protein [Corynebacterium mastitidis]|uniref:hypothetical protein n=1 Tax=Corynebacterium mastitidis TaxID=161890 RepID=UPI000373CF32|nr:hypothetical protein [Corynebacterium mastitidis]